ncbi:RHS repeat protein [Paraburkholderia sediminicola]
MLLSESTKTGFVRTLTYGGSGLLTTITQHAAGTDANNDITLRLDYDDKNRLSRLNDSLGRMTQYGYDANGNLVSVAWPDGYAHRYVYDDTRFKNALTGEIDEAGNALRRGAMIPRAAPRQSAIPTRLATCSSLTAQGQPRSPIASARRH